ncbi:MAG: DUF4097 domain-containing protein [Calothrix sp. SM1_5_4]|nr:DUF4097 domain-containing protein [Calothrix sp. SM1_5_4]
MNHVKWIVYPALVSSFCFALSYAAYSAAGIRPAEGYPLGLLIHTGAIGNEEVHLQREVLAKDIRDIEVKTETSDIRLRAIDGDKVQVELTGSFPAPAGEDLLFAEVVDGRVVIRVQPKNETIRLSWIRYSKGSTLEIQVPRGMVGVSLRTVSGDIEISDLRLTELGIETTSGDVSVRNASIDGANWTTVSGDWSSTGALRNFSGQFGFGGFGSADIGIAPSVSREHHVGRFQTAALAGGFQIGLFIFERRS